MSGVTLLLFWVLFNQRWPDNWVGNVVPAILATLIVLLLQ